MTLEDRTEVRNMIQSTLEGWYKATEGREMMIINSLDKIDIHLDKLNGKVAAHEKTILENLPHGIQHCILAKPVEEIRDAMIKEAGKKEQQKESGTHGQATFNNVFTIISTALVLLGLIVSILLGRKADAELKKQIDNFGTPVIINSRGDYTQLPVGDSLKFYRDGEFKDDYKDSIK